MKSIIENILRDASNSVKVEEVHSSTDIEDLAYKINGDNKERPFILADIAGVLNRYLVWKKALNRVKPFFAVKVNPDPRFIRALVLVGAGFDCASRAEIELAISCGAKSEDIIFANPCKIKDHIRVAKTNNVRMMTFDCIEELDKIKAIFPEAQLVLRMAVKNDHTEYAMEGKFGAGFEDSKLLVDYCKSSNMDLIGISFHVGLECTSPVAYIEGLKNARLIFDYALTKGIQLTLVDIGGGWSGRKDMTRFLSVTDSLRSIIDELFPEDVQVISEPGTYFVRDNDILFTHVTGRKVHEERGDISEVYYYLDDGIYGTLSDYTKVNIPNIFPTSVARPEEIYPSNFYGPSNNIKDCVSKNVVIPLLEVGDLVFYHQIGSYGRSSGVPSFGGVPRASVCYIWDWTKLTEI